MEARNIVQLALDYAAYFQVANMLDPDEVQGASELFSYYCHEKFTAEEKALICRFATEEVLRLRKKLETEYRRDPDRYGREALEKTNAFYQAVPDTLYYFDRKDSS
jgi:hypothetical protein